MANVNSTPTQHHQCFPLSTLTTDTNILRQAALWRKQWQRIDPNTIPNLGEYRISQLPVN